MYGNFVVAYGISMSPTSSDFSSTSITLTSDFCRSSWISFPLPPNNIKKFDQIIRGFHILVDFHKKQQNRLDVTNRQAAQQEKPPHVKPSSSHHRDGSKEGENHGLKGEAWTTIGQVVPYPQRAMLK
jgi:hypothetical protein